MDISGFLNEWNSPADTLTVHTSGSTGTPKAMLVEKRRMLASARITCDFLGLVKGDTALLCLPMDYIAGKMMVVRSLERGLELTSVTPGNHPLAEIDEQRCDFALAAMVPSQVYCSLMNKDERRKLARCRNLIIGGGAVSEKMADELSSFPNAVWSTYGMTETLSHIALRRLSGETRSEWYLPFDGVELSSDADGRLVIDAPHLCGTTLHTNDIVQFAEDGCRFRILGRADNTICCGGLKIQAESIERQLESMLNHPLCVTKRSDAKFGEVAVLLVEGGTANEAAQAVERLEKYSRPRDIIIVDAIPRTGNGKIDRKKASELAASQIR